MVLVHADAVNLARRLSSRAENDLLQENFYEEEPDTTSRQYCATLAAKLSNVTDLPASCQKYPDVVKTLQRRSTKSEAAVAFQGMRAGSAASARAARAKGQEHHAQIQRRYTTSRK